MGKREEIVERIVKGEPIVGRKPGYSITALLMPLPANLYTHGEAYLEAALILQVSPWTGKTAGSLIPLFFCLAQAAELFLKAFLSAKGRDRKDVPGWQRHRLDKLLEASLSMGLVLKERAQEKINEIGQQNIDYEFRFLETTKPVFLPPPREARTAIVQLKASVFPTIRPFIRARNKQN